MSYIEALAPYEEPVVVVVAPRLRCSWADYEMVGHYISSLEELQRSVIFRVSGMIAGPEEFFERLAPQAGHQVEVFGPDNDTAGRVKRLSKNDDAEREGTALLGAHAVWFWLLPSELSYGRDPLENPYILLALELGVPVFLFLPESFGFEVVEVT